VNDKRMIYGPNSHPAVLTVGAEFEDGSLAEYSLHGPGFLAEKKPDVVAYTDFIGSEIDGERTPESGTSAAAPLAAGILAALRATIRIDWTQPESLPDGLRRTVREMTEPCDGKPKEHRDDIGFGLLTANCLKANGSSSGR
jgi:hypothetical protein